ncbi:MAG: DNA double-strand break repair nuclease NurA [Candidatus Caenarcaniphilales bacterium]|nr:DNA double-strand break repair nuclease NurA [Candidatus Caenarcaniphilales bacterium]
MLNLTKAAFAINAKKQELNSRIEDSSIVKTLFQEVLSKDLIDISPQEFNQKISDLSEQNFIGAKASIELSKGLIHPFPIPLNNKDDTLNWRDHVLLDRITMAVDGSQINPDKNLNLYCGAVQVGWFINPHCPGDPPEKDSEFELFIPSPKTEEDQVTVENEIALHRFELETERLSEMISEMANQKSRSKIPLAIFDGSLTLSFMKSKELKRKYEKAMSILLESSQKHQIPLIGYIDTSRSYNLVRSLKTVFPDKLADDRLPPNSIYDSSLLADSLSGWGSRSAYFYYFEKEQVSSELLSQIGFFYLKSSSGSHNPVRIELPNWVFEQGLLDQIVEVVLAECLVGNGYPYPVEVADSVAVLTGQERDKFIDLLQKMTGSKLSTSPKLLSKNIRRRTSIRF